MCTSNWAWSMKTFIGSFCLLSMFHEPDVYFSSTKSWAINLSLPHNKDVIVNTCTIMPRTVCTLGHWLF